MMPFAMWSVDNPSPLCRPLLFDQHTHVRDLKELEAYFFKDYFKGEEVYLYSSNPSSIWHPGILPEKLSPEWILNFEENGLSNVDAFTFSLLLSNRDVYRFNAIINPFEQNDGYIHSFDFAEYWMECHHETFTAIAWLDSFMGISMLDTSIYEVLAPRTEAERKEMLVRLNMPEVSLSNDHKKS